MSRLVKAKPRGARLFAEGSSKKDKALEFGERIAKYVPAEVIAAYLMLLPLIVEGTTADTTRRTVLLAVIVAVGLVFTPLYLWRFPGERKIKWYHCAISTVAFLLWVYSIEGGFFDDIGIYDRIAAAILLVVFSLGSGLIVPTEE